MAAKTVTIPTVFNVYDQLSTGGSTTVWWGLLVGIKNSVKFGIFHQADFIWRLDSCYNHIHYQLPTNTNVIHTVK